MAFTDRHIIDAYTSFFDGLSPDNKLELIEQLSRSLRTETRKKENKFYRSFGAFASEKSAESIIGEIRSARKFSRKDIKL